MIDLDNIEPENYSDPNLILWSDWYYAVGSKLLSLSNIEEVKEEAHKIQMLLLTAVYNQHIGLSTYKLGVLILDAYLRGWYALPVGCLCIVESCEKACSYFDACQRFNAWLALTDNTKPMQRLRVFWDIFIPGVPFSLLAQTK